MAIVDVAQNGGRRESRDPPLAVRARDDGLYRAGVLSLAGLAVSTHRWGAKRDAAEKGLVAGLQAVGAEVTRISGKGAPDLLVAFRGRLYAFEVKSKSGKRTEAQEVSQWPIVRTMDEALKAIGACR